MTSREELTNLLSKINWQVASSGNGLNDFLLNHEGVKTGFKFKGEKLLFSNDKAVFGGAFMGDFGIDLKNVCCELSEEGDAVYLIFGEKDSGNYISFYGFQ